MHYVLVHWVWQGTLNFTMFYGIRHGKGLSYREYKTE